MSQKNKLSEKRKAYLSYRAAYREVTKAREAGNEDREAHYLALYKRHKQRYMDAKLPELTSIYSGERLAKEVDKLIGIFPE